MKSLTLSEKAVIANIVDSILELQQAEKRDKQVLPNVSSTDIIYTMIKEGELERKGMLEGYLNVISSITQNGNWMYLDDPELMSDLDPKVSWSMIKTMI